MTDVMIVEDDDEIRDLLAEMLVEGGYSVSTARNGVEALDLLRSSDHPALILLDLMMPVMDGWRMRAEMLADASISDIPVVVVSGAADLTGDRESLKASRVLTKPVKWTVLLDSVRAHCGEAR